MKDTHADCYCCPHVRIDTCATQIHSSVSDVGLEVGCWFGWKFATYKSPPRFERDGSWVEQIFTRKYSLVGSFLHSGWSMYTSACVSVAQRCIAWVHIDTPLPKCSANTLTHTMHGCIFQRILLVASKSVLPHSKYYCFRQKHISMRNDQYYHHIWFMRSHVFSFACARMCTEMLKCI